MQGLNIKNDKLNNIKDKPFFDFTPIFLLIFAHRSISNVLVKASRLIIPSLLFGFSTFILLLYELFPSLKPTGKLFQNPIYRERHNKKVFLQNNSFSLFYY